MGLRHLADPWVLAGTALPDWVRALRRRGRVQPEEARAQVDHSDPRVAAMARGAVQHFADDQRFHSGAAFVETRKAVARDLRGVLPATAGHRPRFVAHVLVEMLLDAHLAASRPGLVDRYYAALASLAPTEVEASALGVSSAAKGLAPHFERFVRSRFVDDYVDDVRLHRRLAQVMVRARQPALPDAVVTVFPPARRLVAERARELFGAEV